MQLLLGVVMVDTVVVTKVLKGFGLAVLALGVGKWSSGEGAVVV